MTVGQPATTGLSFKLTLPDGTVACVLRGEVVTVTVANDHKPRSARPPDPQSAAGDGLGWAWKPDATPGRELREGLPVFCSGLYYRSRDFVRHPRARVWF